MKSAQGEREWGECCDNANKERGGLKISEMFADIICAWAPSFLAIFLSRALCHQNRRREESGSATSLPSVNRMDRSSSTENGGKNLHAGCNLRSRHICKKFWP